MLVYVNNFELKENSLEELFKQISSWLSKKFRKNITPDFLKSGKELNIKNYRAFIRTYNAFLDNEKRYSILVSHPDRMVKGRQWITEIGIKQNSHKLNISILLETREISTRIQEIPSTTKPKLVNLLHKAGLLSDTTIGIDSVEISDNLESFRNFKQEVHNKDRAYPIVLISKSSKTHKFLVDFELVNSQLLGLAKLFYINENVNTYAFESELGKEFSVWDGSIRIIYPTGRTALFRSHEIKRLESENKKFSQELLSYITHTTNGYKKSEHFSPAELRAIKYRNQRDILRNNQDNNETSVKEYDELLEAQDVLIKDLEEKIKKLEEENINLEVHIDEFKKSINEKEFRIQSLKENRNNNVGKPLICYGKEYNLYDNEIKELIIKILDKHRNGIELNPNSRQAVLLQDLLDYNVSDETSEKYKKRCSEIFSNYEKVTPKMEGQLREMGLQIKKGEKHNELKFINDERFKVSFSQSTSDKIRAGKKISNDIDSELFY